MPTIREIFNAKSRIILGRDLRDPLKEPVPGVPEQLNEYLVNVSREVYFESRPIEFESGLIGDNTFINMEDGTVTDEDGNVLYTCFNEYMFSKIETTLLFVESFNAASA
jgi:hypothetical protein